MKLILKYAFVAIIGVTFLSGCDSEKASSQGVTMKNQLDSVSYAIGVSIGNNFKGQFEEVDLELMIAAIQDVYADTVKITLQECVPYIQAYQKEKTEKDAAENLKKGRAFLKENAKKDGITVTESGLQYEIMTAGDGSTPTTEDRVKVHYHGTLIDGTVFDSSIDRGQPATFGVTQVIAGWTEALQLMPVGSKWKLYIPTEIGYGDKVRPGGKIKANDALIFEVELLEIIE